MTAFFGGCLHLQVYGAGGRVLLIGECNGLVGRDRLELNSVLVFSFTTDHQQDQTQNGKEVFFVHLTYILKLSAKLHLNCQKSKFLIRKY